VERASGHVLGQRPDLPLEARRDLVGGLVGEGDGADAPRLEPVPRDQPRDPRDQAERLARTRPGHDEHGAERGLDGLALGG
jgi:hypothetical protein